MPFLYFANTPETILIIFWTTSSIDKEVVSNSNASSAFFRGETSRSESNLSR